MRLPRIHHPAALICGARIDLSEDAAHHLARVLRLSPGAPLIVFNGAGGEYQAAIVAFGKRGVSVEIGAFCPTEREAPLPMWLAQGISRGERMDYTIQKAVELGVSRLVPLFTERCTVQLDTARLAKRLQHWRGVAVAACEQCGRNRVPEIASAVPLGEWLERPAEGLRLVLDPESEQSLGHLPSPNGPVILMIGPEGGLSEQELRLAAQSNYRSLRLGPRTLRTETAAVAALAAVLTRWGDFR